MKNLIYFSTLLIWLISCSTQPTTKSELAFIDTSKKYPEKVIQLTDIADVSYIQLSSSQDDFLFNGSIDYMTQNTILVIDRSSQSVLLFTKEGIPKSRFNRKGQGPEEYTSIALVMYDEPHDDVFVFPDFSDHILVYSSKGAFKRKLRLPQRNINAQMALFDDQSILVYDNTKLWQATIQERNTDRSEDMIQAIDSTFFLISNVDGSLLEYIHLPNQNVDLSYKDLNGLFTAQANYGRIRKSSDGLLLYNPESDTIFLYNREKSLRPYLHKKPLLTKSKPMTVLDICLDVGKLQFLATYTYQTGKVPTPHYYMRDKETAEIYRQKISLPEYKGKVLYINPRQSSYLDKEYLFELDLDQLEEAYQEQRLSGQLEDLVASLLDQGDANNIFLLAKFY